MESMARANERREMMARARRVKAERPDYDRDAYNRGWRASAYATGSDCLGLADSRGEPTEWYDGYYDRALRPYDKWHLPLCRAHHNDDGGCGTA